jgi:hypothetical protein
MVLSLIDHRLDELCSIPSVESACSLSWAIGSLGRSDVQDASECLPKFLSALFELCGTLEALEDRAKIAAGISFICSSFVSFMQQHFHVMKSVVGQLLSFSRETLDEIQEFTIEALKALAMKCGQNFVIGGIPDQMFTDIDGILTPLLPDNVPKMYEIFAILANSMPNIDERTMTCSELISDLIARFLQIAQTFDPSDEAMCQSLSVVLRSQIAVARPSIQMYETQLAPYIGDMFSLFGLLSRTMAESPQEIYLTLKGDILQAVTEIITPKHESSSAFVTPVIEIVLEDFLNFENARVPETYHLFGRLLTVQAPDLAAVVDEKLIGPTFEMFAENFDDFWELRFAFFRMCKLLANFPNIVLKLNIERFFEILVLGGEHPNNEVRETAISALDFLFCRLGPEMPGQQFEEFCEKYAINIIKFALRACCDVGRKATFQTTVFLCLQMLQLPVTMRHLADIAEVLAGICPSRPAEEIRDLTVAMMQAVAENQLFIFMKDLLVSLNQIAGTDPDLNPQERLHVFKMMSAEKQAEQDGPGPLDDVPQLIADFSLRRPT